MPVYTIEGMTCGHCARAVQDAVQRADPGADVAVDLAAGRLSVAGGASAPVGAILAAVAEEGYTAHLQG